MRVSLEKLGIDFSHNVEHLRVYKFNTEVSKPEFKGRKRFKVDGEFYITPTTKKIVFTKVSNNINALELPILAKRIEFSNKFKQIQLCQK